MGLTALDNAITGLRVSQQQLGLISSNISNATTPGYTRKTLPIETQILNGQPAGANSGLVMRNVNLNLQSNVWTQISAQSSLNVQQQYLNTVMEFHGPPEAELSIAAEVSRLHDSFVALSDNPSGTFALNDTVNNASDMATKINDFASLLNTLRSNVQDEVYNTVNRINELLVQIADLNAAIFDFGNANTSPVAIEDQRDEAVKALSGLIDIDTYRRGDNTLVIQTADGIELASTTAFDITHETRIISPQSTYPEDIDGIIVTDTRVNNPIGIDLTERNIGGKLGGLLTLRDTTFVKQSAQLDELAHKMALRFQQQGLNLFTNASGLIPNDNAPDPTTDPVTTVSYLGFASQIQVNDDIIDDPTLLRRGTYGADIPPGSSEVINRVIEFTFGSVVYEIAQNDTLADSVDLLNRGGADLQSWLGLTSSNALTGGRDLSPFLNATDLINSTNGAIGPTSNTIRLTFEESRTSAGPVNIDIDLSAVPDGAGNFVDDLNTYITGTIIPALPAGDQTDLTAMNVTFGEGTDGQWQINTQGSITVDGQNAPNSLGQDGLDFLGLVDNVGDPIMPNDPYFDIAVGENDLTRITLEPGDTHTELLAKLAAVDGLGVDTTNFALDGFLRLRPGDNFDAPRFGGELRIIGGPFDTSGATLGSPPAASGRTAIDDGVNIVAALFGTYTAGTPVQNNPAINEVTYGSITDASLATPVRAAFRTQYLGADTDAITNVGGATTLLGFSQQIVYEHTSELNRIEQQLEDEGTLRTVLEERFLNDSAVNIDNELTNLIIFQTQYSASARMVNAVNELFDQLLNII